MTTKTEAASEVRKVLQGVKDFQQVPDAAKLTEADTRAHFIDPLLRALGYQAIGDLQHEVFVPNSKTYLDYRLWVEGRARVALEAKALGVSLNDDHGAQVIQYCSVLGDEWGAVTNARQLRIYHAFAQGGLPQKLVLTTDLLAWDTDVQFDNVFEQLWLISKESFTGGNGPSSWLTSQQLDHVMRLALTTPGSPEVKYIQKRLLGQGVAVSAEQVAAWLKAHLEPTTKAAAPTPGPVPDISAPVVHPGASPSAAPKAKPVGIGYWLIPAGRRHGLSAAAHLQNWLNHGFWGFGPATPGRKLIHAGDRVAFYAAKQNEVVAYARITGEIDTPVTTDEWPEPYASDTDVTYKVPLSDVTWLTTPVRVDAAFRAGLDAFAGREQNAVWQWFVQTTRRITEADYRRLTGT